jgi:hypothetical protein
MIHDILVALVLYFTPGYLLLAYIVDPGFVSSLPPLGVKTNREAVRYETHQAR